MNNYKTFITGTDWMKCEQCGKKIAPNETKYYIYEFSDGVGAYFDSEECVNEYQNKMKKKGYKGKILSYDVSKELSKATEFINVELKLAELKMVTACSEEEIQNIRTKAEKNSR